MLLNLVKTKLLYILEKIPYRTRFGLSLADELKYLYYKKIGYKTNRCLCGGKIVTKGIPPDGWETSCLWCELLIDED
jgi:hypothetical protein